MDKVYKKYSKNGQLLQEAKIVYLRIGKYGYTTKLTKSKNFELNMNMPLFNTEVEAANWIEDKKEWQ